MLKYIYIALFLLLAAPARTGTGRLPYDLEHIYDPSADAAADLERHPTGRTQRASTYFLQIGGNWCHLMPQAL